MAKAGSKYPGGSKKLSGLDPLAYTGVEATTPPDLIQNTIDPQTTYNDFRIGTCWVNTVTNGIWMLTNLVGGTATWTQMGGFGDLTLNGDVGSAVAVNFEIDVPGDAVLQTTGAGNTLTIGFTAATDGQLVIGATGSDPAWANITSSGGTIDITNGANTINLEINTPFLGARIFDCDVGSATVSGQTIVIAGGTNINTSGASNVVTINTDTTPTFDDVIISNLGEGFIEADATGQLFNSEGTDGQIVIAKTSSPAKWANLTSNDGSIDITTGPNTLDIGVDESLVAGYSASPFVVEFDQPIAALAAAAITGHGYDEGNSVYILSGNSTIYTATSLTGTWTLRNSGTFTGGNFIYANSTNVFLSFTATIAKVVVASDATSTWTEYTIASGGLTAAYDIGYDGTYWVATGRNSGGTYGVYYTSDITGAWTFNSTGITGQVFSVAYGNSTWVAVGVTGTIFTASNPTGSWTSQSNVFSPTANINDVTYSSDLSLFLAGGTGGASATKSYVTLATSSDGVTWTGCVTSIGASGRSYISIGWDSTNKYFFAATGTGISLSKDTTHWIDQSITGFPGMAGVNGYNSFYVGNGKFMGYDVGATAGRVYYSLVP